MTDPGSCDELTVRNAQAGDYEYFIERVDEWWGGRRMHPMLPRLFFQHFRNSCFVACTPRTPVGFLCGFLSQSDASVGYVHFIGVDPSYRGSRVGARLHAAFEGWCRQQHPTVQTVYAITSPANVGSQEFHRRIGFQIGSVVADYDGPGEDRALMTKALA
mmetsp:Transcript_13595/g.49437  ORF Transcript_13595/g.49437 Transcript_13595/m.49437 type:complete len:160 (+) Transcript_13595:88-567(+)